MILLLLLVVTKDPGETKEDILLVVIGVVVVIVASGRPRPMDDIRQPIGMVTLEFVQWTNPGGGFRRSDSELCVNSNNTQHTQSREVDQSDLLATNNTRTIPLLRLGQNLPR